MDQRSNGGWPRRVGRVAILTCGLLAAILTFGADLMEIYRLAQASDPTFDVARYTLDATREKIPQARAGLLPTVAVNGNDNRSRSATVFDGVTALDRDVRAWTWTVQLTQPLVRLQNVLAYSVSESLVEQAEARFALAEQDLILTVSQAYFDVLVAQEAIAAAIANRFKTQAQVEQARRKAADARQAFAAIMNALSQVEALESAVESSLSAVKGNQTGYKLGIRISSDVPGAQQQIYTLRRDLAKARYDTLFQGLKLNAAAGVLAESDLATINGLLVHAA